MANRPALRSWTDDLLLDSDYHHAGLCRHRPTSSGARRLTSAAAILGLATAGLLLNSPAIRHLGHVLIEPGINSFACQDRASHGKSEIG